MAKTSKGLHESTITRMQELASAWVFKRAIQDNKGWQRYEHLKKEDELSLISKPSKLESGNFFCS